MPKPCISQPAYQLKSVNIEEESVMKKEKWKYERRAKAEWRKEKYLNINVKEENEENDCSCSQCGYREMSMKEDISK
jgi:hypothetical protein